MTSCPNGLAPVSSAVGVESHYRYARARGRRLVSGSRVPLAIDAQVRAPFGPVLVPLRALVLLSAAAPIALALPQPWWPLVGSRLGLAIAVMMSASRSRRRCVRYLDRNVVLYRLCGRFLTTAVLDGDGRRARVQSTGDAMKVSRIRQEFVWRPPVRLLRHLTGLPTVTGADAGVVRLNPGGARGSDARRPWGSPLSEGHARWCSTVVQWLLALECPAQLVSVVSNLDSQRAQGASDVRQAGRHSPRRTGARPGGRWPSRLELRHFVVLSPGLAAADGIPWLSRATRLDELSRRAMTRQRAFCCLRCGRPGLGIGIVAIVMTSPISWSTPLSVRRALP